MAGVEMETTKVMTMIKGVLIVPVLPSFHCYHQNKTILLSIDRSRCLFSVCGVLVGLFSVFIAMGGIVLL